jgi:hypothetical protein
MKAKELSCEPAQKSAKSEGKSAQVLECMGVTLARVQIVRGAMMIVYAIGRAGRVSRGLCGANMSQYNMSVNRVFTDEYSNVRARAFELFESDWR